MEGLYPSLLESSWRHPHTTGYGGAFSNGSEALMQANNSGVLAESVKDL